MRNKWQQIHFREVQVENIEDGYLFHVPLWLNGINPDDVSVELYANGINGQGPEKIKMETGSIENNDVYNFHTKVILQGPPAIIQPYHSML